MSEEAKTDVPDIYVIVDAGVVLGVHSEQPVQVTVIDLDTNDYSATLLAMAINLPQWA